MKEKIIKFIKDNTLIILAFIFNYIAPLVMLIILACEGKSSKISMSLWGSVVGFLMIIVYMVKLKKLIHDRKEFEKHEMLKVSVGMRIAQLVCVVIGFVSLLLVLSTVREMFDEIFTFSICCFVSVVVGNLFLVADSKKRVAHKVKRD